MHGAKRKHCNSVGYAKDYHPPTAKQQRLAVGSNSLPYENGLDSDGNHFFNAIPSPKDDIDWLAKYNEFGQTFAEFMQQTPWLSKRKYNFTKQTFVGKGKTLLDKYPDGKIYITLLDKFQSIKTSAPNVDSMIEYASIFLGIPVILTEIATLDFDKQTETVLWTEKPRNTPTQNRTSTRIKKRTCLSRYNKKTQHFQLCVDSPLKFLQTVIPADALCLIGLTMHDLYADDEDLFVAGMAAGNFHVGVFSFHRYDPRMEFSQENWYNIDYEKFPHSCDECDRLVLQRCCRLLVHEIGHLLGLDHCIYYECCMNGSGHLAEDFRQPMHLCPVCLHKLHALCGFSITERYQKLHEFYKKNNLKAETTWTKDRIDFINKTVID